MRRGDASREELVNAIVDSFPDIGFVLNADGEYVEVLSGPETATLGYDHPADLVGKRLDDVLPQATAERFLDVVQDTLATGEMKRVEYPLSTGEGERWFEGRVTPIVRDDEQTNAVLWVARDITRLREEIQSVERRSEAILESLNDVFYLVEADGNLVRWNAHLVETTRYTDHEIDAMNVVDLFVPSERGGIEDDLASVFAEGFVETERRLLTKDGRRIPYLLRMYAFEHPTEGTLGCAVGRDISDLKRYEEELETRTNQLGVLNQLLRHDIRNDLTAIIGWSETVMEEISDEQRGNLQRVVDAGKHAVEITELARDLAESIDTASTDLKAVALDAAMRTELEMRRELYPDAEFDVTTDMPGVRVDADDLLPAVFRNLLNNAVQHNRSEHPTVEIAVDERAESVVVSIADDGPGIEHAQKKRIFGRSNKGLASAGSGMGLYLVDVLVDRYGGEVWVEDDEPSGSVFYVELLKSE